MEEQERRAALISKEIVVRLNPDDVRESFKLGFEAVKQMTTLSAGSFVIIATFLRDIFPKGANQTLDLPVLDKILIGVSFMCFVASLLAATFSLWRIATIVRSRRGYRRKKSNVRRYLALPALFFTLALSFFGTAVVSNVVGASPTGKGVLYAILVLFVAAIGWTFSRQFRKGRARDREVIYVIDYPQGTGTTPQTIDERAGRPAAGARLWTPG